QALAHQMQGNIAAALMPLERALTLAEREGYVRLFVDEGPPMAHLLREAAARNIMPNYTDTLLASFPAQDKQTSRQGDMATRSSIANDISLSPGLPVSQSLVEPLSERERDVLR